MSDTVHKRTIRVPSDFNCYTWWVRPVWATWVSPAKDRCVQICSGLARSYIRSWVSSMRLGWTRKFNGITIVEWLDLQTKLSETLGHEMCTAAAAGLSRAAQSRWAISFDRPQHTRSSYAYFGGISSATTTLV